MWSGWTCIVIRPYGGGEVSEVPEDDSTTASRVSRLRGLHWDKLDLSAVWFWFQPDGGWPQILTWHTDFSIISFQIPFNVIFFFIFTLFLLFYSVFLKSVMVQLNLACFFHYSELWYSSLVFCSPLYFQSLVVLSYFYFYFFLFLVVMLHPSKGSDHILNGVQTLKLISWIVFWWSSVTLCSFCIKTWIGNHGPNIKLFSCFKGRHWCLCCSKGGVADLAGWECLKGQGWRRAPIGLL